MIMNTFDTVLFIANDVRINLHLKKTMCYFISIYLPSAALLIPSVEAQHSRIVRNTVLPLFEAVYGTHLSLCQEIHQCEIKNIGKTPTLLIYP